MISREPRQFHPGPNTAQWLSAIADPSRVRIPLDIEGTIQVEGASRIRTHPKCLLSGSPPTSQAQSETERVRSHPASPRTRWGRWPAGSQRFAGPRLEVSTRRNKKRPGPARKSIANDEILQPPAKRRS